MKTTLLHAALRATLWATMAIATSNACLAAAKPWLSETMSAADARHLISRTGLGVSKDELVATLGLTRADAIDAVMEGFRDSPDLAMPAFTRDPAPLYWTRQDLLPDERRRFDRQRDTEFVELRQWWIDNLLTTSSPQTERMVLFWHDHFATSYHGIDRQSIAMARQNQTFREHGMGDFRTLVKAMIRDPALLNYLDNISNRKGAPNENLARELLELFTLGEGSYDEYTVREAARALTGFNVSQEKNLSYELQPWSHDTDAKTLFGKTTTVNGDGLVDALFEQAALPRFIALKFWHAFIADQAPTKSQLDALANDFTHSGFSLSALYRSTLESQEFWSADTRAALVKSPVQLIIGFARSLEYPKKLNQQLPSLLTRSGMNLFAPPNVSGWTEGAAWVTSGRLLNRYEAIDTLAAASAQSLNSTSHNMGMSSTSMMANNKLSANSMSMSNTTDNSDKQSLRVQIAGEDYLGPVAYRVELLNASDSPLWNSGDQILGGGHDTRKYGRVRNGQDLPWQTIKFDVPKTTLAEAQFLQVHFLNDSAGDDGDRNMYVNGAGFANHWIDSANGSQSSGCVPNNKSEAGNLYCAGKIKMPLSTKNPPPAKTPSHSLLASSVHLQWIRWLEHTDELDLTLVLQDLYYNENYFPTYSFHLNTKSGADPMLTLNSYGCWPECVTHWPECSWKNDVNPDYKTLAFPLSGASDSHVLQCHHDALLPAERKLIQTLMARAPALLSRASSTHRNFSAKQKKAIAQWQKLFENYRQQLNIGGYSTSLPRVAIDKRWRRKSAPAQPAHVHTDGAETLEQLGQSLSRYDLTIADLLLPGIDKAMFESIQHIENKPLLQQLPALLNHPVFQLH